MKTTSELERKLREHLLLAPRPGGDRLMLDDAVLRAALDGSRPLTAGERAVLRASPLTTRRLRTLALAARAVDAASTGATAANDAWHGSSGMLRAADSGAALVQLATDDGFWRLHFVEGGEPRVILQLMPDAPFAARLLRESAPLRVLDGAGAQLLAGRLDLDGECEAAWPFAQAPAAHFQRHGATFSVQPAILTE
ncbi:MULTISPECIES: hypothetical protein [unclassified Massilia]|uniref:hypothetical protein n=1 Tax=unclassified Massilia TaxID=2609279 RepID=UPI001783B637|nr:MULTISPECIES: hypothetical protein [unclassified Massilia]MBD8532342.1 hypothetical protein [Massilia sp. CFBP 13647]MBD8673785.1 hypothetical protein [Massilia sp. CFBP 13721]